MSNAMQFNYLRFVSRLELPVLAFPNFGPIHGLSPDIGDVQISQTIALIPTCKASNPGDLTVGKSTA
jgi:hypothetical protein